MSLSNKSLIIILYLVGLALVICHAAELPKPASLAATVTGGTTAAEVASTESAKSDQLTAPGEEEDEDDQDWTVGGEDDDEEDYEEYDDEDEEFEEDYDMGLEDSPEEDLAELSAEHFDVKQDCADIADMLEEAKANGTATVDPNLQRAYDECKQDLKDIETEMRSLADKIDDED